MKHRVQRSYAGQAWAPGLFSDSNMMPGAALQIIGRDLVAAAREHGITEGEVELWGSPDGTKGFFVGDTRGLVDLGWTKLATL